MRLAVRVLSSIKKNLYAELPMGEELNNRMQEQKKKDEVQIYGQGTLDLSIHESMM